MGNEAVKSSKLRRFWRWVKKHHVAIALILGAFIVAATFVIALQFIDQDIEFVKTKVKPKTTEKIYSSLTGRQVSTVAATTMPVTAVMIENSPEARPQSGLKQAGVVYEAVAEGGITRFIALYQQEKPELIGPVRSLRAYYLDWAAPYQASIAHVGGSDNALDRVRNGNYRDLDQFFNAGSYWRASDRYAPHNVYTNFEQLDALNASKNYTESSFSSFPRTDGKTAEEPNATSISVNFSSASFNTSYTYNAETNNYARSLADEPHNDREQGQITPDVVVVLKTTTAVRDSSGYEDVVTTGGGQAYVFQNGTVTEVTWKKEQDGPLELVDGENKPISLNRGQTWIAAITGAGSMSWQ